MKSKGQLRVNMPQRKSVDLDAGKAMVTVLKVQDPPCIHCQKHHRKPEAEERCAAKAKAKLERAARPVCECGVTHRTEATRQACQTKREKQAARANVVKVVCPHCRKVHRSQKQIEKCQGIMTRKAERLAKKQAKDAEVKARQERMARTDEIAKQL